MSFPDAEQVGDRWCRSESAVSTQRREVKGEAVWLPGLTSSAAGASASAAISSHRITRLARGSRHNFELCHLFSILSKNSTPGSGHSLSLGVQPSISLSAAQRPPAKPRLLETAPQNDFSQCTLKQMKYALVDIRLLFPVLTALASFSARESDVTFL